MQRSRSTWRHLLGAIIVMFWAVMMALLIRRERPATPGAQGEPRSGESVVASERWLGLFADGARRIGTVHLISGPETVRGARGQSLRAVVSLHLRIDGAPARLGITAYLWRETGAHRAELRAQISSDEHQLRIVGRIDDGVFDGELTTGGDTVPLRVPIDKAFLSGITLSVPALPDLSPGAEVAVDAFDPFTLQPTTLHVRLVRDEDLTVAGRTVRARVVTATTGSLAITAWLGPDGDILQAETPLGVTVREISSEEAFVKGEPPEGADLVARTLVRPTGAQPRRGARRMVVRVSESASGQALPHDDTQRAIGPTTWEVDQPSEASIAGAMVPVATPDDEVRRCLAADALAQSGHPRIRDQAARIVGNDRDPWRRAKLLSAWVFENLVKRSVLSLPSALDVLASREGDCNEHAMLFTALARAVGVPTRIAVGVVWSDELGGFGYHAWPEVWVGRWVWIDPTLGQPVADATHLKLLAGGIEAWPQVLSFLGRIEIEVVEIE